MKILVITQKADLTDPILGFFHRWLVEFGRNTEKVTVICLEKGECELPDNISVYSLGKEEKSSMVMMIANFYRLIWSKRKDYDAVFVHMNPEYVILGGFLWKMLGKKVALWYTHKNVDLKLRIAEKMADIIFTASDESLRLNSKKKKITGHGIDTKLFVKNHVSQDDIIRVLTAGRISETKNIFKILEVMGVLFERNIPFDFHIYGQAVTANDFKYETLLREKILNSPYKNYVHLDGAVPNSKMPEIFGRADVFLNLSNTGSLDKAVLEAMSAGLIPVTSNEAFRDIVPPPFFISSSNSSVIADALISARGADTGKFESYVRDHHSLSLLVPKIISFLSNGQ